MPTENMSVKRTTGAEIHRREAQSKVIQDRITATETQLGQLCDVSSSYTRKTARLRDKGDMMAKQLMEFSEMEKWNPTMTQGMTRFAENLSAVQDHREAQVKRLESKVVSPLVNYGLLCKQTKNDLRSAFSASDREINQMKKLETLKNKNPNDHQKISQLATELQRASLDASRSNQNLEQKVDDFESKKLVDMKKIMRDFVTVEMHFHAKALELYTQCFQTLNDIDPEADLEEFRKQLRPNGSIRSDIARSASQASLESRSNSDSGTPRRLPRPGSHQGTPTLNNRSNTNNTNTTTTINNSTIGQGSAATNRRKIPVPPLPTNDDDDDSEDDDDDDDDEYDSEDDDYTETETEAVEKPTRRR